jgi:hypothetical protein
MNFRYLRITQVRNDSGLGSGPPPPALILFSWLRGKGNRVSLSIPISPVQIVYSGNVRRESRTFASISILAGSSSLKSSGMLKSTSIPLSI